MNSCAASSCTCFRKASCAFATSHSSPTGAAPLFCRFAFICSARHSRPSKRYQPTMTRTIFNSAPNVVDRLWSSKGLLLPRSNFVLLPPSSLLPHETILYNTKPFRASARSVSLCLLLLQTASSRLLECSSFTPTSLFSRSAPTAVLFRSAPAHLHTTPSLI